MLQRVLFTADHDFVTKIADIDIQISQGVLGVKWSFTLFLSSISYMTPFK